MNPDQGSISAARARRQERKAMRSALLADNNAPNDDANNPAGTRKPRRERRSSLDAPIGGGAVSRNNGQRSETKSDGDSSTTGPRNRIDDEDDEFDVMAAMDSVEEESAPLVGRHIPKNHKKKGKWDGSGEEKKNDSDTADGSSHHHRSSLPSAVNPSLSTPVMDKPYRANNHHRSRSEINKRENRTVRRGSQLGSGGTDGEDYIPPIAVSPRLQEVSLRDDGNAILLNQLERGENDFNSLDNNSANLSSRFSAMLFNRNSSTTAHRYETYSEALSRKCGETSDKLYNAIHYTKADWLNAEGEGTFKTSSDESIIRFGGASVLKERMIRDLVSLVDKESFPMKRANEEQIRRMKHGFDESSDDSSGDSDNSSEEKKGEGKDDDRDTKKKKSKKNKKKNKKKKTNRSDHEHLDEHDKKRLKEMAYDSEVAALSNLRSRGFATLDDMVDAYGDMVGCDDPIIHHSMRPMIDRHPSLTTTHKPSHIEGETQNSNYRHQQGVSFGHVPLTVVRNPSTGVGPSIKAAHTNSEESKQGIELVINLGKICLYDHPFFWPEDVVACLLRASHAQYVREMEDNPSKYLSLRLNACVKAIEAALTPKKIDDPKLNKLIERAYPNPLGQPISDTKSRGENQAKAGGGNSGVNQDDKSEEEEINVSLLEMHWQEAVTCLGQLLDAERTARALTKHVYMLWRALLVTREELGRVNAGDDHDSYGRGGKMFQYNSHNEPNEQSRHHKSSSSARTDRVAVSSLKLKIVKNPFLQKDNVPDNVIDATLNEPQVDPLTDISKLLELHDKLAKTLMSSIASIKKSNDEAHAGDDGSDVDDNEDNDDNDDKDLLMHKDRIQSKTDSDNRKQFYESRKVLRDRHASIKAMLISAQDLLSLSKNGSTAKEVSNMRKRKDRKKNNSKLTDESKNDDIDTSVYDNDNVFDEDSNASSLNSKVGKARFDFIMNLTLDGKVSNSSQLSRMLKRRRHRIASLRVYALLHVNGNKEHVARIPREGAIQMSDVELKVFDFLSQGEIKLEVIHAPTSLELSIYSYQGGVMHNPVFTKCQTAFMNYETVQNLQGDVLLGKVGIPLPGGGVTMQDASVISIGGNRSWFQFSSPLLMHVPTSIGIPKSIFYCSLALFDFIRYYYNIVTNNASRNHRHDEDSEAGILLTERRNKNKQKSDENSQVTIGSIVKERTKVEKELYSKVTSILHNRRTHGSVLVSVKWLLPKRSSSSYEANLLEEEEQDDYSDTNGQRTSRHLDGLPLSPKDYEQETKQNFMLPGEKLELETGMLVGLKSRQQKPWQQSSGHKPSAWSRPLFARESGFTNTLPDAHHIDPLDYRDAPLLRYRKHHRHSHHGSSLRHGGGGGFGGPEDCLLFGDGKSSHNTSSIIHQKHKKSMKAYNCRKNEIIAGLFAPSTIKDLGVNIMRTEGRSKLNNTQSSAFSSSTSTTSSESTNARSGVKFSATTMNQTQYGQMKSLVNPANFLEPARHVLLKLRKSMPTSPVFAVPIPMSEKEILRNESYRQLLKQVGWLVTPQQYENALKEDIEALKESKNISKKTLSGEEEELDDGARNKAKKAVQNASSDEMVLSIAAIRQTLGFLSGIALELGPSNTVQQSTLYQSSYRKHASTLLSSTFDAQDPAMMQGKGGLASSIGGGGFGPDIKHLGNKRYYSSNQLSYSRSSVLVDLINHYRSLKQRRITGSENARFIASKVNADIESIVQEFEVNVRFDPLAIFELDDLLPSPHRKMRPQSIQRDQLVVAMAGQQQMNAPHSSAPHSEDHDGEDGVLGTKGDSGGAGSSQSIAGNVSYLRHPEKGPDKVIVQIIQAENVPFKKTSHSIHDDSNSLRNKRGSFQQEDEQEQESSSRINPRGAAGLVGKSSQKKEGWEAAVLLLGEDDEADMHKNVLEEEFKAHVCVQVKMRGRCEKFTSTQYGKHPMWKESLILSYLKGLKSKAAHAEEKFDGLWEDEEVVITLFDMVPISHASRPRRQHAATSASSPQLSEASRLFEKRYLGRAVVPLSAAIHGRVESFLRVETPEINMDYTYTYHGASPQSRGKNRSGARDVINRSSSDVGVSSGIASDWMSGGMVGAIGGFFGSNANDGRRSLKDDEEEEDVGEDEEAFLNIPPSDCRESSMKRRAGQRMMIRLSLVLDPPPYNYTQHNSVQDIAMRRNIFNEGDEDDETKDMVWGEELDIAGASHKAELHPLFGASNHQHEFVHVSKFTKFNHSSNLSDLQRQVHSYASYWLKGIRKLVSTQDHPLNRVFLCYARRLDGKEVLVTQLLRKEGIIPPKQRHFPARKDENDKDDFDNTLRSNRRMKRRAAAQKTKPGGGGDNDEEEEKKDNEEREDEGYKNEIATIPQICRFVSLLPVIKSTWAMKQLSLWCSCSEFLEMGAGGGAEHATLLWHYLVFIQNKKLEESSRSGSAQSSSLPSSSKRVVTWDYYLLFGRNMLGDSSWFVIGLEPILSAGHLADIEDNTRLRKGVVFDPYTGEAFNINDHRLNISDIGCLLSPSNIFANIQVNGKPSDLARSNGFNLYDTHQWKSLFPHENPYQSLSSTKRRRYSFSSPRPNNNNNNNRNDGANAGGKNGVLASASSRLLSMFSESNSYAEEAAKEVMKWGSVQKSLLDYGTPADMDECIDIAQRIQDRLRDAITEWRTDGRDGRDHRAYPVFAPDLRAKALLKDLERRRCGYLMKPPASSSSQASSSSNMASSTATHQHQLVDLAADSGQRSLHGVALNFSFTDMITIEERLKETAIHDTTAGDVLFLLAVHVAPFPNGVFSVWVFYGNMPRNG